MKAVIIYHTRYGNTERIAKSLEIGLKEASGIQDVVCTNVRDVVSAIDSLKEYDIICIGAPTEGFSVPKPIKEFLAKLKGVNLDGKYGFAFDTKLDSRLSSSAAKFIEKELSNQGLIIIAPRESAIVFSTKERGAITRAKLKEGEEERFRKFGTQLGRALAARQGWSADEQHHESHCHVYASKYMDPQTALPGSWKCRGVYQNLKGRLDERTWMIGHFLLSC